MLSISVAFLKLASTRVYTVTAWGRFKALALPASSSAVDGPQSVGMLHRGGRLTHVPGQHARPVRGDLRKSGSHFRSGRRLGGGAVTFGAAVSGVIQQGQRSTDADESQVAIGGWTWHGVRLAGCGPQSGTIWMLAGHLHLTIPATLEKRRERTTFQVSSHCCLLRQTSVTAHLKCKQLLMFAFATATILLGIQK